MSDDSRMREMTVQYLGLGRTGLSVSRLGLGMMSYGDPARQSWALTEAEADPIVRRAVETGITFFDTADMYSDGASEQITGRLLRKYFSARDDYVLATKVYYPTGPGPNDRGLSRKHITAGLVASLRRLGTDFIDLYQAHRWDVATPSTRPSPRWTTRCGPGWSATSGHRRRAHGNWPRPTTARSSWG
jgi:aryl-alcohol dehydrogenase-like predicted oxidoreductase